MLSWEGIVLSIPFGWLVGMVCKSSAGIYPILIISSAFIVPTILLTPSGYVEAIFGGSLGLSLHLGFLCLVRRHVEATGAKPNTRIT